MIQARARRAPSPATAALVRLAAFLVAAVSIVLVPVAFCLAAIGHASVTGASEIVVVAVVVTLATTLAARSLDPLRR